MALDAEKIRATAQRVAASHGLDVVDLEFQGGGKHRLLRVFIEKNAEERRKQAAEAGARGASREDNGGGASETEVSRVEAQGGWGLDQLAGVTHTDCEAFSRDFGTVVDVEDLIPGGEYTLEVSSPGLDRKLHGAEDFQRFAGMLAKVQTFEPVAGNRHWQGRLTEVKEGTVRISIEGRGGARRKKSAEVQGESRGKAAATDVEIALSNIEKAQLVPEF